jgi:hypothetical protein
MNDLNTVSGRNAAKPGAQAAGVTLLKGIAVSAAWLLHQTKNTC